MIDKLNIAGILPHFREEKHYELSQWRVNVEEPRRINVKVGEIAEMNFIENSRFWPINDPKPPPNRNEKQSRDKKRINSPKPASHLVTTVTELFSGPPRRGEN